MAPRLLCTVSLLLLLAGSTRGVVNLDPDRKQLIDAFVNSLLFDCEKHQVAGMNLAVVFRGEVVYTTGYGVRDLGE